LDLSGLELEVLVGKFYTLLRNYYINNVYSLAPGIYLFRFHRSEKEDLYLLVDEDIGLWLTKERPAEGISSKFLTSLRKEVLRGLVKEVRALKGERIVEIHLKRGEEERKVILEFFRGGNLIVTGGDDEIRLVEKELEFRHRVIRAGITYTPPPKRGIPFSESSSLVIEQDGDLPIAKYIGRKFALGRKFVEEILHRAEVDKAKAISRLTQEEVKRIEKEMRGLAKEVKGCDHLYAYYEGGELREVSLARLGHLNDLKLKVYEDVLSGLDEVLTPISYRKVRDLKAHRISKKLEETLKGIENQRKKLEELKIQASVLRDIASKAPYTRSDESLLDQLRKIDDSVRLSDGTLYILGRRIEAETGWRLATRLFELAKELERGASELEKAIRRLEREAENLKRSMEAEKVETKRERKKRWFEKFRWFTTSEGFLAIGGRDASTNSLLIRKYMEEEDLVFHADVAGSPFFLLKKGKRAGELSIKEVAIATVSFSRAWRLGLLAADAYYVTPKQVRTSAPSGEYLPRGSFMIVDKRTYLKGLELRLGVGITYEENLPLVLSGPTNSVRTHCKAYVEIEPGHLKQSETAKRIRSMLEKELKASMPPLEEFQRALPPGNSRIVGLRKTIKSM
jgi:predicted ribosome quality control (RQC) complex YloA/Tae2 family protein